MLPMLPMLQKFLKLHTRSNENFTHRRDDPNATAVLGPLMRYWVARAPRLQMRDHMAEALVLNGVAYRCHPADPEAVFEDACAFHLQAMDAAIDDTPTDLLILAAQFCLPTPGEWEQSKEWVEASLPSDIFATAHPLAQKARTLFLERIDTPRADFMAYRGASVVLAGLGLLDASEDGSPGMKISPEACAAFPSLKRRENDVLRRSEALEWRPLRPGG